MNRTAAMLVAAASPIAAVAAEPVCLDDLALYDNLAEARPNIHLAFVGFNSAGLAVEIWRDAEGWIRIERGAGAGCIVESGVRHTDGGDLSPCLIRAAIQGIGPDQATASDLCP